MGRSLAHQRRPTVYPGCITICDTILSMARTVQARLDDDSEHDLAVLRNEGNSDSEAIRLALRESAERRRRKSALRLEAEAAAADPDDVADARRVRLDLDAVSAAWTDAD
jgi:Arc/MetJ-type ribon-helix-helix transcriptional regulator